MRARLLIIAAIVTVIAADAIAAKRRAVPRPAAAFCDFGQDVPGIVAPDGFCVRKFADVPTPRVLTFASNGDLFVSSPKRKTIGGAPLGAGAIFLLRQTSAAAPPQQFTFAQGDAFESVHGLIISGDRFYYTIDKGVYAVPFQTGDTVMSSATPVAIADLSTTDPLARWTHSLAADVHGALYVSRGQFENEHCPPPDPRMGAVLRIGGQSDPRGDVVAQGLRDPLYIRCMPWDACYAMELSGEGWETLGGTEKLVEVRDSRTYGYPCCIDRTHPNPDINPAPDCSVTAEPKLTFALHTTPFGFDWERKRAWPPPYAGALFVGFHGDYAMWTNAGLQWAPADPVTHDPSRATTDFITGVGFGRAISRIADVVFAPDGRLFFCDDQGGAIYWIAPRTLRP